LIATAAATHPQGDDRPAAFGRNRQCPQQPRAEHSQLVGHPLPHVVEGKHGAIAPANSRHELKALLTGDKNRSYNLIMLIWDEAKRQANIAKHGYDFAGVESIWDQPVVSWDDEREYYGEQRINLLGWLHGQVMFLTYTDDGDHFRVISLRKADKHETGRYIKTLPR